MHPSNDALPKRRGFSARCLRDDSHGENGIDVRGRVHLHNIEMRDVVHGSEPVDGATAIVFGARNHDRAHGAGGAWNILGNNVVTVQSPVLPPSGDPFTLDVPLRRSPAAA